PYLVKLLNVEVGSLTPHEHNGEEFFFVLDGELELTTYTGEEKISERLQPGDFCYLDSSVPHLLRSETRNPYSPTSADVIVVFWCPLGEGYLFGD
ncbi:MAG: cupin domain-containing protein, partial [Vicinamibacteria bacterium]